MLLVQHTVGIICNGVTGRQGRLQHLKALVEIRDTGGVQITNGEYLVPDLILVGRDESKLTALCESYGIKSYSTDFLGVLSNPQYLIYLDTQITERRYDCLLKAIRMGKVTFSEMPLTTNTEQARELAKTAQEHAVKGGVVQNMMYLPGMIKLRYLLDTGFFGKILKANLNYSYWLPDGKHIKLIHPKWIFQKESGGIIRDFFGHVRYLLENTLGKIISIQCSSSTNIKKRWDLEGNEFECTSEDNVFAIFELENNILAQISASWNTRTSGLDIFTFQLDGTSGSAVATLSDCYIQPAAVTPVPRWNAKKGEKTDHLSFWHVIPDHSEHPEVYRMLWESFLKYVFTDSYWQADLKEAVRDVALIEAALNSCKEGRKSFLEELATV